MQWVLLVLCLFFIFPALFPLVGRMFTLLTGRSGHI